MSPSASDASSRHPIRILSTRGLVYLADLTDQDATTVGRHWNAIRRYLETGEDGDLADLEGAQVRGFDIEAGRPVVARLETDPDAIESHALRGDVSFESIYDEVQ